MTMEVEVEVGGGSRKWKWKDVEGDGSGGRCWEVCGEKWREVEGGGGYLVVMGWKRTLLARPLHKSGKINSTNCVSTCG